MMSLILMNSVFKWNRIVCRKLMTLREQDRILELRKPNSCNNLIPKVNLIVTTPKAGDHHKKEVKELHIPVPYGHIAAKAWGKETDTPILALHGWMDNAGSFDKLIPLLSPSLYVVAIDFPGHGLSSHKPPGWFYTLLDTMIDIKRVINHLEWTKLSIIGHSMGAAFGQFYTGLYPETVQKTVALDLANMMSQPAEILAELSKGIIEQNLKAEKKLLSNPPVYSVEEAAHRISAGMFNEIPDEAAKILMRRGTCLSDCGNGVVFTRDLRARTILIFQGSGDDIFNGYLSAFKCETLLILSKNTHPYLNRTSAEEVKAFFEFYKRNCKRFLLEEVEGNHYVHLSHPERIASLINSFLS